MLSNKIISKTEQNKASVYIQNDIVLTGNLDNNIPWPAQIECFRGYDTNS